MLPTVPESTQVKYWVILVSLVEKIPRLIQLSAAVDVYALEFRQYIYNFQIVPVSSQIQRCFSMVIGDFVICPCTGKT